MTDIYDVVIGHLKTHKSTKIFDVGAGTGELGLRIRKSGLSIQYKGLDRDECAIKVMKKKKLDGVEGDIRWYDGHKYYWDTVVMQDVVEYLQSFSLLADAIRLSRRLFVMTTEAALYDSLMTPRKEVIGFHIDDILSMAHSCSFGLTRFEPFQQRSILVFTRYKKGQK